MVKLSKFKSLILILLCVHHLGGKEGCCNLKIGENSDNVKTFLFSLNCYKACENWENDLNYLQHSGKRKKMNCFPALPDCLVLCESFNLPVDFMSINIRVDRAVAEVTLISSPLLSVKWEDKLKEGDISGRLN